ncbi:hypothetical protein BO71DRAFT_480860 [Aspergillus ellipticus CBS 707.79]|uniref:Uncharacterized protein n=1 Tax=Aspergillus ellipticus CBS 707.79 TaxID=1448320 RepID=A0A319DJV9_9EURO|nr:hypothetical protein BO71DRAFT_480860 [Aspergillus ellipticus CBS 707.79]
MASNQRLMLASMWAFEDVGVQEVTGEIKKYNPKLDLACEYNKPTDVLEINGNIDGCIPRIAKVVSAFIENQKDKDLLDMPRVSQLENSAPIRSEAGPGISGSDDDDQGLLTLDEDLITHSPTKLSKVWLSPNKDAGCLSINCFQEFITPLATLTGTEMVLVQESGIQVTGNNPTDVEDALAKLSRIEKTLVFAEKPNFSNVNIAPEADDIRFRIQNYGSLNRFALNRILSDPSVIESSDLGQMFVTVLLSFDKEARVFREPANLLSPPHVTEEPGSSRIWNDFKFQEFGKGDQYLEVEAASKSVTVNRPRISTNTLMSHPYLTMEKVNQVNQWVVEGVGMENALSEAKAEAETEAEAGPCDTSRPSPTLDNTNPVPATKRPPGIKARRVIPADETQPAPTSKTAEMESKQTESKQMKSQQTESKQVEPRGPDSKDEVPTPRKKWKMTYSAEGGSAGPTADVQQEQPITPEKKMLVPPGFDPTQYGLKNRSPQPIKNSWGNSQTQRTYSTRVPLFQRKVGKPKELIDVFGPVTPAGNNPHPALSLNQPALVPTGHRFNNVRPTEPQASAKLLTSSNQPTLVPLSPPSKNARPPEPQASANLLTQGPSKHSLDLAGLTFETLDIPLNLGSSTVVQKATSPSNEREVSPSDDRVTSPSNERATSSSSDGISEQAKRLSSLNMIYTESKTNVAVLKEEAHDAPPSSRQVHMNMAQDRVMELNRTHKIEKRSDDEIVTRDFHRTMAHRAPKSVGSKSKSKAEANAKRQATLEDAWGKVKKPLKKQPDDISKNQPGETSKKLPLPAPNRDTKTTSSIEGKQESQKLQTDKDMDEHIRNIYEALKPTLEAAEFFPGAMTLEIQIGLLLIPLLPKTYSGHSISLNEWVRVFRPRNGLDAPSTKFINRVTTSGADTDHFVDLRTSKAEGKRRMFEQEYSEYNISYEYHCRTNADKKPFIIVIDEQGNFSIRKPVSPLGGVNLHFPGQTWDATVVVNRIGECLPASNPEFQEAAQHMVGHLWVQPDKELLHIFTSIPGGNTVSIEKAFMKRWTRHKYIRPNDALLVDTQASGTGTSDTESSATEQSLSEGVRLKSDTPSNGSTCKDQGSPSDQSIFLQVKEVQDLFIGYSPTDAQAVRARATQLHDMIERERIWYEVSLVSPAIESLLKSNATLEVGERVEDWHSADLFGRDAILLPEDDPTSPGSKTSIGPVATAVGTGGVGDLLRLTKQVVEKADGVGFWNQGPAVDTFPVLESPVTSTVPDHALVSKGRDFNEIESIKEAGSATAMALNPAMPSEGMAGMEEPGFW